MAFNVITTTSHEGERLEGGQYSADLIDGLGGNDTLVGHDGADVLLGNMGDDRIYAGARDTDLDIIAGGDGNDHAYGGGGGDLMDGGAGSDMMGGGTGNDLMFGESIASFDLYSYDWTQYNDETTSPLASLFTILGHVGIDDNFINSFPQSEAGNDTMWGGSGRDMMFGSWGDDVIGGGAGEDLVVGNRNNDTLFGAGGNDVVLGGDEDDVMYGGAGDDILDGDETPMNDNLYEPLNGAPAHEVEGPHQQVDYLDGVTEWVSNDDNHNGNDLIFGGDGNDWIHGREGADTLWGGTGNDTIRPGNDNDTDIIGFIADHGNDIVIGFDAGEWPEGGNAAWENGEDIIDLSAAEFDGEFEDAVDLGAIVFDNVNGTVTINTTLLGLGNTSDDVADNTIVISFEDPSDYQAFGANNILLNGEDWVDMTASFQNLA